MKMGKQCGSESHLIIFLLHEFLFLFCLLLSLVLYFLFIFFFSYDLPDKRENYFPRVICSRSFRGDMDRDSKRKGVVINFVTPDDVKPMREMESYYNTQMEEMPMNVADLL